MLQNNGFNVSKLQKQKQLSTRVSVNSIYHIL